MNILDRHKNKWAEEQAKQSEHPLEFWLGIVDATYENRTLQKLDMVIPLGHWLNNWDVFSFLVKINDKGIKIEKEHGMQNAFAVYEVSVAEAFQGSHPYDRLRIWYTKNKKFKDAIRVCQAYLNLPNRPNGQAKDRFRHHYLKLCKLLDKQNRQA